MGKEKSGSTTVVNQTTTPTPTAEETELNRLMLERERATQGGMIGVQQAGLSLINQLLTGGSNLPGLFGNIQQGVPTGQITGQTAIDPSKYMISPDITNQLVQESLRQITPNLQTQGLLDSGTRASIAARTAGDINRQVAERNLNTGLDIETGNIGRNLGVQEFNIGQQYSTQAFNMGNLINLLNLALSGQAQVQQPVLAQGQTLSNALAGLRSTNTTGTSTTSQFAMNPFLKSFQTSLGSSLGGGIGGAVGGGMGAIGRGFRTPGGFL